MKYSVIGGVCLLLSSCSFRQRMEPVDSAIATLAVPANEVKGDIPFDSLFRLKEIIPLQTTDESLVQRIDKLSFYNGRIYLLDARKKQVVVFDGQGRFERVVNHFGQGPGEYQSLVDMQLKNDTLYLLDRYGAKLLLYSLDGVFLSESKIQKAEGIVVTRDMPSIWGWGALTEVMFLVVATLFFPRMVGKFVVTFVIMSTYVAFLCH